MPRSRDEAVARPRLVARLNGALSSEGGVRARLSLVTAPAGYGKTTLVTQWAGQLAMPVAWLSLDAGENDVSRFLAYLFAAIATVQEEIGETALARLTTAYANKDAETLLTVLLNELAVSEETVVLVLDDYHLITADAVHQAVTFLLQHMPVQFHLVITSRVEPPLPVAHLRAQSALVWLSEQALRFTENEAAEFLERTMGVTLSPAEVSRLDRQVEGWVAGLQLVALALHDSVLLETAFSGNQRYLVDYLAEQVLDKQSPAIRTFLLQTGILDQFCSDLCDYLMETSRDSEMDSRTVLRQVEAGHLFLVPLDAERRWYRYHHLFADFLRGRLRRRWPAADIARLHRRAAQWYHEHDQDLAAVEHALAAGDSELAADLIGNVARQLLMHGEGSTLRHWVDALPPEALATRPRLSLFYGWALVRTGDISGAAAVLEEVAPYLDVVAWRGEWAALRARLAVMSGETDVSIQYSRQAMKKLDPDEYVLRSEVAINLGFSHLQRAEIEPAREAFSAAAQLTEADPSLWSMMFASFYWGQTYEREGRLVAAQGIYQRGLELAAAHQRFGHPAPAVGYMHAGLGRLLYEWNLLAQAEGYLRRAVAFGERSGDHKMLYYGRETLAELLATVGERAEAERVLGDLERQTGASAPSMHRALLGLRFGETGPAEQWSSTLGITLGDEWQRVRRTPFAYMTLIRLRLAQREFRRVSAMLAQMAAYAEERHSLPFLLKVQLLQALAYTRQGDVETALRHFRQMLALAEPGGYVRLFLDSADASLARLLHLSASGTARGSYARRLLAHLEPGAQSEDTSELVVLSARELEVLQLLAAGMSNRDSAARLVVSVNTIKAHNSRLYRKLGVSNRTQAVARARQLGLL